MALKKENYEEEIKKPVDIDLCRNALTDFMAGTVKHHEPPRSDDPDILIRRALDELQAYRENATPPTPPLDVMFVDPGIGEAYVFLLDVEHESIKRSYRLGGVANLCVGQLRKLIETHSPAKLIINKIGIGSSYECSLRRFFEKLKAKQ
jgi:hypothetical protein